MKVMSIYWRSLHVIDRDYVGHCIKNPATKLSKALHAIPSKHKLVLTGTPIQNNLNEFYQLISYATNQRVSYISNCIESINDYIYILIT